MFWKTCLTHAGEILLALGGSWILGYLWSRWFGSSTDPKQIDEYEDQISALRDRIKFQDQEIKAGLIRQDTSNSELIEWKEKNSDLTDQLSKIDSTYGLFLSPTEQKIIQDQQDFELKLKQDQILALTEQRDQLTQTLKGMDIRLTALQVAAENNSHSEDLKSTEEKLHQAHNTIVELEQKLKSLSSQWEEQQQLQDLSSQTHSANSEASKLETDQLIDKNKELQAKLQELELTQSEKENQIQIANKKLEETRQISKELESKYISQLEAKDQEIIHLKTLPLPQNESTPSSPDELAKELAATKLELSTLQSNYLEAAHLQQNEPDANQSQKMQELQIQNQQLSNELGSTKNELKSLTNKLNQATSLEKNILDITVRSKEWEGRWREAATEAEQFKVAHASLVQEKDVQSQRMSKLEADLAQFNTVLKDYELKEAAWMLKINQYESKLKEVEIANQTQAQIYQDTLLSNSKKVEELQQVLEKQKSELEEGKGKWEELQNNFSQTRNQLTENEEVNKRHQVILQERQQIIESLQSELLIHQNQLAELQQRDRLPAHKEVEWDLILKSKEEELKQAQLTITELVHANESKLNKLNHLEQQVPDLNSLLDLSKKELLSLESKLNEQGRLNVERENKNEELHHQLQLAKAEMAELNQLKESQSANLGNWEHLYNESQLALNLNKQQFSEIEKNSQAMDTLVAEWEKKYHQVQHELNDVQHQLSASQQWIDSQDHADEEKDRRLVDAETRASEAQIQLQESRNHIHQQHKSMDELERKYNDLYTRFNIVQLQFADNQRIKSHLESDMKKATDYQAKYQTEIKTWQKRITELEADFNDQLSLLQSRNQSNIQQPSSTMEGSVNINSALKTQSFKVQSIPDKTLDLKVASVILAKKIIPDNHQIVEGIGPKIASLLKRNKVRTWQDLSEMPVKTIQSVLNQGGQKFRLADPETWPFQAKLASSGKWVELKKFQDKLKQNQKKALAKSKNKKPKSPPVPKPIIIPFNPIKAKEILGKEIKLNDLKIIEGIGPKIEILLKKAKIRTWEELSNAKLLPLRSILKKAGKNFSLADPKTWAAQAKLAHHNQWKRLRNLQDKLTGGKL